jgi:WD40 repeat protein
MAWSPDAQSLALGLYDNSVRIWEPSSGQQIAVLRGHYGNVNDVDWSPDGATLATASDDGSVMVWDALSWEAVETIRAGLPPNMWAVSWSPDSTMLVIGGGEWLPQGVRIGGAQLWATGEWAPIGELGEQPVGFAGLAWSPDGTLLSSTDGHEISIWAPGD